MKLAIMTCGILPIPAVQGGAVENLIDFYLEYNDKYHLHNITVYSPWDSKIIGHPALASKVNHYHFIDVSSLKARVERRLFKFFKYSNNDYFNYFIEFFFEKVYVDVRKKQFDYILLENCDGFAYKLSQRGYKNIILHMHNERRESRAIYDKIVYNSITKIITVSDYIKGRAALHYPIDKIETIHNGIDLKNFEKKEASSVNRQQLGFVENDFVMVYSGRVNKDKGISELVDTLIQLREFPQIKLMVLGGSFFDNTKNEDEFIRSLKDKVTTIKNKIVFTGFIPYNQVPNYLQLADIAVLPSMWDEPFGLTIVEALAAGLPLITTQSGGIPEICEGVATIVERENIVNNLTTSILYLYEHPEKRKEMAAAGIERAKLFDKGIFARNLFEAIEINK